MSLLPQAEAAFLLIFLLPNNSAKPEVWFWARNTVPWWFSRIAVGLKGDDRPETEGITAINGIKIPKINFRMRRGGRFAVKRRSERCRAVIPTTLRHAATVHCPFSPSHHAANGERIQMALLVLVLYERDTVQNPDNGFAVLYSRNAGWSNFTRQASKDGTGMVICTLWIHGWWLIEPQPTVDNAESGIHI